MKVRFTGEPKPLRRIGLDAEALPAVSWNAPPIYRHALCFGWGELDEQGVGHISYVETKNRRPGRFKLKDLKALREAVVQPDVVIVGHNAARYDLPLLNGVLLAHGLDPLPEVRCIDTMNDLKTGLAYKNTLSAQCKRYDVTLKTGGPDWDLVMFGDKAEWLRMQDYNVNDVVCTLQLERALAAAGLPCPVRVWRPRKGYFR